jgi:hypothetical protein
VEDREMSTSDPKTTRQMPAGFDAAWGYPLMEAIFKRRTRRIALGSEIPGGPTQFKSEAPPLPLDELEEALLVQAATGLSGLNLADLPFCDEQGRDMGGNTMIQFAGRTWPSPCASHDTELFYWNDEGTYVMKLHETTPDELLLYQTRDDRGRVLEFHRKCAVKLFDGRPQYSHSYPTMLPFNILNVLLLMCGWPDGGITLVDPENENRPAGCERWIKEGLLNSMYTAPISYFGKVSEIESGFIIQNLLLAIQAMGLGGWVHAHPTAMVLLGGTPLAKGLGFRFVTGKSGSTKGIPSPVGLEGVMEAYCPPFYPSMDAAVDAVVEAKFGSGGLYDPQGESASAFANHHELVSGVPRYSDALVQCVKDICNYIYETMRSRPRAAGFRRITWTSSSTTASTRRAPTPRRSATTSSSGTPPEPSPSRRGCSQDAGDQRSRGIRDRGGARGGPRHLLGHDRKDGDLGVRDHHRPGGAPPAAARRTHAAGAGMDPGSALRSAGAALSTARRGLVRAPLD